MNKHLFILSILFFASTNLTAQVGLGTSSPDASAALEVASTTQGFLPPRMTAAQRDAISNPATGLVLYCTDCGLNGELQVYNGTFYTNVVGDAASTIPFTTQLGSDIDGEAAGDQSGTSVSLSNDGTVLAIGAPFNDDSGNEAGQVRVFEYSNEDWIQLGSDIGGESSGSWAGRSVSLSANGDIVAIGSERDDNVNGLEAGQVQVYEYSNSNWIQLGSDIHGESAFDFSGVSISLSSDGYTLAVGADDNDDNGGWSGHVRIYSYSSNSWTQIGGDINGEAAGDRSGRSISLSSDGNTVAIGAFNNDGNGTRSGHVRVYQNINNSWTQLGNDIDGETSMDLSGLAVSISGDATTVAVGAPYNDDNGSESGHVRVYQFSNGTWSQKGGDIDGEAANDKSGNSISLSNDGEILAIGAYVNDGNGVNSGQVRIYQYSDIGWSQIGNDIDGESQGDQSGYSVSLSADGSIIAIGAKFNADSGSSSGHVRVFRL